MQQANNGIKLLVFPAIRWEFGLILFRHGKYQVQSNMQQVQEEESHNSQLVRSAVHCAMSVTCCFSSCRTQLTGGHLFQ